MHVTKNAVRSTIVSSQNRRFHEDTIDIQEEFTLQECDNNILFRLKPSRKMKTVVFVIPRSLSPSCAVNRRSSSTANRTRQYYPALLSSKVGFKGVSIIKSAPIFKSWCHCLICFANTPFPKAFRTLSEFAAKVGANLFLSTFRHI